MANNSDYSSLHCTAFHSWRYFRINTWAALSWARDADIDQVNFKVTVWFTRLQTNETGTIRFSLLLLLMEVHHVFLWYIGCLLWKQFGREPLSSSAPSALNNQWESLGPNDFLLFLCNNLCVTCASPNHHHTDLKCAWSPMKFSLSS